MHSVCSCSLQVWRRSFLKKRTPVTYFCPALDPPLGGSGQKTTTLVRDLEYFIHTKFYQNPSSSSGEEVENVNCLTDRRQTTDAGQRMITIGHWSLRLLCPKNMWTGVVEKSDGLWMVSGIKWYLLTDESQVVLGENQRIFIWRRKDEAESPDCMCPSAQRKVSVMIWGWITYHGVGTITTVDGTINRHKYIEVLENNLWPICSPFSY